MIIKSNFNVIQLWKNDDQVFEDYHCPFYNNLILFAEENISFFTVYGSNTYAKQLNYINENSVMTKTESHEYYYFNKRSEIRTLKGVAFPKEILLKKASFNEWIIKNNYPSIHDCLCPVFNVMLANGAQLFSTNAPKGKIIFEEKLSFNHGIRIYKK